MVKIKFIMKDDFLKLKKNHTYTGTKSGNTIKTISCNIPLSKCEIIDKAEKKEKSITVADYKMFSDMCFEIGIRFRDGWKSVITGKRFDVFDYSSCHAGHGCSRQYWDTRHVATNCHCISQGENFQMSIGNAAIIGKYWDYVKKAYGQNTYDELVNKQHDATKLDMPFLREECKRCFNFLSLHVNTPKWQKYGTAKEIIINRLDKLPKRITKNLYVILETM